MDSSAAALQLVYHIHQARLGRRRLAQLTHSTEMSVRTELERLRARGFVRLDHSGVSLTDAGLQRFAPLLGFVHSVADVVLTSLYIDRFALAAHLAAVEPGPVWTLRDASIREGATGLLLLQFGPDGWSFAHNGEPIHTRNVRDAETIGSTFPDSAPADLLLISAGPVPRSAGLGLWQVVLTLLARQP